LDRERRRSPRYSFIASAELIETNSDVRIASRVSELSLHGCYLDMINPFPINTPVLVKISAGEDFFQAHATVVYAHLNMGAGLRFETVAPSDQAILERWVEDASHGPEV
jgi:hypothetical protein